MSETSDTGRWYRLTGVIICVLGVAAIVPAEHYGGGPLVIVALGVWAIVGVAVTSGVPACRKHYLWPLTPGRPSDAEQRLHARMWLPFCLWLGATLVVPALLEHLRYAPRGTALMGTLVCIALNFPFLNWYSHRLSDVRRREQERLAGITSDVPSSTPTGGTKQFVTSVAGSLWQMVPGIFVGAVFVMALLEMSGKLQRTQHCAVLNIGREPVEVWGMTLAPGQTAQFFAPDDAAIDVDGAPAATFKLKGRTAEVKKSESGRIELRFTDE